MMSFLPSQWCGNGKISTVIPNYDAAFEQRSRYPYTYTSIKTVEDGQYASYSAHSSSTVLPRKPLSERESESKKVTALKPKTLSGIMVVKMDPLAAMYSSEWMNEIEQEFRDKIRSFLSEDDVSKVLGKTRCRDCLYYFEKSTMKPSKTRVRSIGMFLSFWWGTTVKIGDVAYRWSKLPKATNTESIELSHLDNGEWVH